MLGQVELGLLQNLENYGGVPWLYKACLNQMLKHGNTN
jgi:hypothetical protein